MQMATKLDLKKQVRLFVGAIIDFGNDVKYHCTKCYCPTLETFGEWDPVFEAESIVKNDAKFPLIFLRVNKD